MSHANRPLAAALLALAFALPAGAVEAAPAPDAAKPPEQPAAPASPAPEGELRKPGARWPFKDGDRLYWFGASHTNIGIYCSTVEFYLRTRLPEMKVVSAHTSSPTGLRAGAVAKVLDERRATIVFPEGGFYDTHDPAKFVGGAEAVNQVCKDKNARCIFLPTMWLAGATRVLPPEYKEKDADLEALNKKFLEEKKIREFMKPAEMHGLHYRMSKGLALDRTMAALKEWGDKNGVLVLETYADQADWAKAQWARDPEFVFLEGTSPHPRRPGYMCVGYFALERMEAPIFESRLELDASGQAPAVKAAVNCAASELSKAGGGIKFKRTDKVLPVVPPVPVWEIPAEPAPVLKLSPYFLKVAGLAAGDYEIAIEGTILGRASAEELAKGVNLNEVCLKSGAKRSPKLPWSRLWDACRGNTMDKDFAPQAGEAIGKAAWTWEVKAAK